MHIETYLKLEGVRLPDLLPDGIRYVVADGGVYRERRTAMFTTCTRLDAGELRLAGHREYCLLACGKLPRVMHRAMLAFFKYAHLVHGGEAALILLYHPGRRRFRWHCPEQTIEMYWSYDRWVPYDHVEFEHPLHLPDGYVHFGDAHLHPGTAYPSALDIQDDQDGLHIIVGGIERGAQYHVDFVMDGVRFRVPEELIFEDPDCEPYLSLPRRWLRSIRIRRYGPFLSEPSQRELDGQEDHTGCRSAGGNGRRSTFDEGRTK